MKNFKTPQSVVIGSRPSPDLLRERAALRRRELLTGMFASAAAVLATGTAAPLGVSLLTGCGSARAGNKLSLRVGSVALGCILEGFAGEWFLLELSGEVGAFELSDGTRTLSVSQNVLEKGEGAARSRVLDDARNAASIAASARDALLELRPELREQIVAAHKAWARAFARKVLAWTQSLTAGPLHGKSVRDDYGRLYALEWAGAKIDPSGTASPVGLATLAVEPAEMNSAAYVAYLETLVGILAPP